MDENEAIKKYDLITLSEACRFLEIGRIRMNQLISRGMVPTVKLPGSRKIYVRMEIIKHMIACGIR